MITRDQFLRAYKALTAYYDRRSRLTRAADELGYAFFEIGFDPIVHDMRRLLEDMCFDRHDPDGTEWPDNEGLSTIEAALTCPSFEDEHGDRIDVSSPEAIWSYWEQSKTGPFSPWRDAA